MSSSKAEIDQALVDVRRAYRLLHDYQRAALDTVKYIGTRLGFVYSDGCANFSEGTPRGSRRDLLDCWSWDWLNLVFYDFTFTQDPEAKDPVRFAIWLFSDTGFFCSQESKPSQTDVSTFATPERSGTKIGFFIFRAWKSEYDGLKDDREQLRHFIETGGDLPRVFTEGGVVARCYDFSAVADQESTDKVISDLKELASNGRFLLNPVDRGK